MKIIGISIMVLGVLIMVLGGLGFAIYSIYWLVTTWATLSFWGVVWYILTFLFREVFALVVGAVVFIVGESVTHL